MVKLKISTGKNIYIHNYNNLCQQPISRTRNKIIERCTISTAETSVRQFCKAGEQSSLPVNSFYAFTVNLRKPSTPKYSWNVSVAWKNKKKTKTRPKTAVIMSLWF